MSNKKDIDTIKYIARLIHKSYEKINMDELYIENPYLSDDLIFGYDDYSIKLLNKIIKKLGIENKKIYKYETISEVFHRLIIPLHNHIKENYEVYSLFGIEIVTDSYVRFITYNNKAISKPIYAKYE